MTDYTELKRLAEAATPGPWQAYDTHGKRFVESMLGEAHVVCDTPKKQWLKDSVFIAAANPSAVLALIAENERLEADTASLEFVRWSCKMNEQAIKQAGHETIDELAAERDQLKAENEALRKALTAVRESVQREYWDEYAGLDETREILDAAMSKEG